MSDLDRTATAAVLTHALHEHVSNVHASPDLPQRVVQRRRRRDRIYRGGVAVGAIGVIAVVTFVARIDDPVPATIAPAASTMATPSAARTSPNAAQHPYFDVTDLPSGYAYKSHDRQSLPGAGAIERVDYGRAGGGQITLGTVTGDRAISLSDFAESNPEAEEVVIGARTVIHVQNDTQHGGLNIYQWTERPGLNVIIDGRDGATDAELRQFIAGLRARAA